MTLGAQSCLTLCDPMNRSTSTSLSITNSRSSLKLMSIELVMPSNNLILCHPLLLLPPIPPSIRVFSKESTLHIRWPKYWSFSFSIIPSKEHPGLISFRMDWLDLLAVQGTLRSLLQHHSAKELMLLNCVLLEKTLESPLDCKEIQPVHSEGELPWDFIGRNDAKAETPVLWPPDAKS